MTIQKRTLISPEDIVGIEYECKHCKARYSVPLDQMTDRTILKCPNCYEQWISGVTPLSSDYSDEKTIGLFVFFLKDIRERTLGANIRFEIREDAQKGMDIGNIKT